MRSFQFALCSLAAIAAASPTQAATFTVGNDVVGCTHQRLADAVAAAEANGPGADTIRITSAYAGGNTALSIVGHSLTLIGGYASCTSATPHSTTALSGSAGKRAITIAAYPDLRTSVELHNLVLRNGTPSDAGGGIAVFGNASVIVHGSRIEANRADRGGGLYVDGMDMATPAVVEVDGTMIVGNFARLQGGGVFCRGDARVMLVGTSQVLNNGFDRNAVNTDRGGGAYLDHCQWHQTGGEISGNRAKLAGGGMLARAGAEVLIEWSNSGDALARPRLERNLARSELGIKGVGGGIAAEGAGTQVDLFGTLLQFNQSEMGGAISVRDGARLSMQRDPRCQEAISGCSILISNGGWGASPSVVEVFDASSVSIAQTAVSYNTALKPGNLSEGVVFDLASRGAARGNSLMLRSVSISYNDAGHVFRLADAHGGASERLDAQFLTLRNNTAHSALRVGSDAGIRVSLRASIIDESTPLQTTAARAGDIFDCLLSRAALGVNATRSLVADPQLDDYLSPTPGSPALDFCSADRLTLNLGDLHGNARAVDLPGTPNRFGPIDVGAIEVAEPSALLR